MIKSLFALAFASCFAAVAVAKDIQISGDYEISSDSFYDTLTCTGDTVISYTAPAKKAYAKTGYWWQAALLVNENCTVTLDFSACDPSKDIFFGSSLALKEGAKLRIKGTKRILFGNCEQPTTLAAFDAGDVKFVDADGAEVTLGEGEGVVFMHQTTLWTMPTCRHSFAEGAEICLGGVTAAEAGIFMPNENNEIVVDKQDLYVIDVEKIDATATIRVKPGRKFSYKPCTRNYPFAWTGASSQHLPNPIILESEGTSRAKLFHRASKQNYFKGAVTGDGDFEFTSDNYGNPGGAFMGTVDFTGSVYLHGNANTQAASPLEFYFATNCPGNAANPVKITGSTLLGFSKPNKTAVPANVSIASLTGGLEKDLYAGTLYAQAGQTISVGTLSGPVNFTGYGTVEVTNLTANAVVTVAPTVRTSFGTVADGAKIVFARTGDSQSFDTAIGGTAFSVTPRAGVTAVTNSIVNGRLDLAGDGAKVGVRSGDGSSLRLDTGATAWQNAMTFWMDPTALRHEVLDFTSTNANPRVELVHDAREGQTYLLQNNYQRTTAGGHGGNWHKANTPYPTLMKTGYQVGGVDMPYLSCEAFNENNARLYIGKEGVKPYSSETMPSKFVVMVFGSQNQGGAAIVKGGGSGNSANPFGRCADSETPTTDMPVFTNAAYTTWIDGVQVDPTKPGLLNGGWQVISFKTCGQAIAGFGYNVITYQRAGGQNYGDIMVFSRELADVERINVEKTLAAKWGIVYKGKDAAPVETRLDGTGTATVGATDSVRVSGLFRGTLALEAGAQLEIGPAVLPPTAEDVAKIGGRVNWFDPEAEGAFHLSKVVGRETEIGGLYDRVDGAAEGAWMLYGVNFENPVGSRCPWLSECARGIGAPVRKWMDFRNRPEDARDTYGNMLRYRPAPFDHEGNSITSNNYSRNVRTAVVVFDSCRPGGNPVLDALEPNGLIKGRTKTDEPIWPTGCAARVKNGKQYLNGLEVDGSTVPFGGKPEVFAFTTTEDLPVTCQGNYNCSETFGAGEIIGETLFFSGVLADADRQTVENYLMAKWFGYANGAYSDLRGATVTGAGAVSGARAALPRFGADFTGTVTLTDVGTTAFGYADGAIVDALDFGGGTFVLPAKVSVSVATRLCGGDYALISAGTLAGDLPALELTGDKYDGRDVSLILEDGQLKLRVSKLGLQILIR